MQIKSYKLCSSNYQCIYTFKLHMYLETLAKLKSQWSLKPDVSCVLHIYMHIILHCFRHVIGWCLLSRHPMTTGSSVLGVKFDGGVIIAADTLGSYGSLARYRNCSRVMKVNDSTVLGGGGDYADYQYLKAIIEQRMWVQCEADSPVASDVCTLLRRACVAAD